MYKTLSALSLVFLFGSSMIPAVGLAQTASGSIQAQVDLLIKLQDQIRQLQAQMQSVQTQREQVVAELVSTLKQGSEGDQVAALQALLAADPQIYPEGFITGFFGPATGRAVK